MKGKLLKEVIDFKIEPKTLGIYKLYNARWPHIYYVGSSRDIRRRLKTHLQKLETGKHSNYKLKRIYNMFPDELRFELLETYPYGSQECDDMVRKREEAIINFPPEGTKLLNLDKTTYRYKRS
jgi:hypothetical protein